LDWMSGSCSSTMRQSPVDLPPKAKTVGAFQYKYAPVTEPFDLLNNGHSFSADFAGLGCGGLTYNDAWYDLLNVNVHAVSEHAWGGVKKPLELHLVHKHYATEALLIVAVAFESATPPTKFQQVSSNSSLRKTGKKGPLFAPYAGAGSTEPPSGDADFNPTLQAFLKLQPPAVNTKVSVPVGRDAKQQFDFNTLLSANGGAEFYEYAGSLTAPPCAEIVTWLVRKDTLKASDKQVAYLHDAVYKTTADFGNWRQVMPLNGRIITMRQGMLEDLPPTAAPSVPSFGEPEESDREFQAMKWAMDAMKISKGATDYIKDLDNRLRNAAEAHSEALAPGLEPLNPAAHVVAVGSAEAEQARMQNALEAQVAMQDTAKTMAKKLAEVAREEVEDATKQISGKSKEIAIQAAREAALMVRTGQGNPGVGHAILVNEAAKEAGLPVPRDGR